MLDSIGKAAVIHPTGTGKYSKLMYDEDFIDTINSEYFILDEFHRCLSAGNTETPIIFDLVNNFESLYSVEVLRDEIDEAFE